MLNKTKIAIAAALVALSATAGLASNENDGGNETGGFVLPPSTVGVNPAYHPEWFPDYPRSTNNYGAGEYGAYGYVPPRRHVAH